MNRKEPEIFKDGRTLSKFIKNIFPITEEEGQKLIDYMNGHDYCLSHIGGEMLRGDLCEQDDIDWEPYSLRDLIEFVIEANSSLIEEAEIRYREATDIDSATKEKAYLDSLREDEKILDKMWERAVEHFFGLIINSPYLLIKQKKKSLEE